MSEQIRRCVGSIIFVPDRRRFGDLYVRILIDFLLLKYLVG